MSTPSGWYPDPSDPTAAGQGKLRWWDGQGWTEHTHDATPTGPVDLAKNSSASSTPEQQRPWGEYQQHQQHTSQQHDYRGAATSAKAIATPDGQALGGLGYRLLARVIDSVLVALITAVAGWSALERLGSLWWGSVQQAATGDNQAAAMALLDNPNFTAASGQLTWVFLSISAAYTILSLRFYGATPGKAICGLRVRQWDVPGNPSWWRAIVRWATSDLVGQFLVLYPVLNYLWPLWDKRRQALHDKLGKTVVVQKAPAQRR